MLPLLRSNCQHHRQLDASLSQPAQACTASSSEMYAGLVGLTEAEWHELQAFRISKVEDAPAPSSLPRRFEEDFVVHVTVDLAAAPSVAAPAAPAAPATLAAPGSTDIPPFSESSASAAVPAIPDGYQIMPVAVAPATSVTASVAAAAQPCNWGLARPLGASGPLPPEVSAHQLAKLAEGHALQTELGQILATSKELITVSTTPHPDSACACELELSFVGTRTAVARFKISNCDLGIRPMLALMLEPDIIELPRFPALPNIERVRIPHRFATNDLMYSISISPFGPFPGVQDLHNVIVYDLLDTAEPDSKHPEGAPRSRWPLGAITTYVQSPPVEATEQRGWRLPPLEKRRTRNVLQGAIICVSPSSSAASGERSQPFDFGDFDVVSLMRVDLPIPHWLIPAPLVRWIVPQFIKLFWPILLRHAHTFEGSEYAERMVVDEHGFYTSVSQRFNLAYQPVRCPVPSKKA